MRYIVFVFALVAFLVGSGAQGQEKKKKVELAAIGWGSLSGKVTLDARDALPPVVDLTDRMKMHPDKNCCLAGKDFEKVAHNWVVDRKTRAVANVLIWVKPPIGTYFPIHEKYKKRADEVVLDQPHCAFLPHVVAYNPSYFDGAKIVETGQKLIVKNSAVKPHNVKVTGLTQGLNQIIAPGGQLTINLEPERLPLAVECNIHPWMNARIFVSDHPYYAITKDDGGYEIPIVPAGAEITIVAWHEERGYVLENFGVKKMLMAGKNTFDFEVKLTK